MPKITIIIIILIFAAVIYFISRPKAKPQNFDNNVSAIIKGNPYYLEVAKTFTSRQTGLSHRTDLCSNCGMLFVFDREGKYPFWMKDTKIPLDIIWLNSKFEVVKIITATETDSLKSFTNDQPALYVIELNANEVFKLDLKVGDIIQLSNVTNES
ncbi:MAG TPA: DUF192 domain-containing protein [Candidatus Woesebacteria bacterium]|jgi:uncharacterized protein|nr:DUF192 domain-containing protein [Candidatus Woesebacteria bacterium]HOG37512.1 DUF192 domain-containing protein [Candidatus Woesebacteria bacterium]